MSILPQSSASFLWKNAKNYDGTSFVMHASGKNIFVVHLAIPRSRGEVEPHDFSSRERPREYATVGRYDAVKKRRRQEGQHGPDHTADASRSPLASRAGRLTASGGCLRDCSPHPAPSGTWPRG